MHRQQAQVRPGATVERGDDLVMIHGPSGDTVYDIVGGQAWFDDLVAAFYRGVEADPLLRPMYPDDLADARRHLALFLSQYWGGPTTYSDERGHPRLRMRHVPFAIGSRHAAAWLGHMTAAIAEMDATPEIEAALLTYFTDTTRFLQNRPD